MSRRAGGLIGTALVLAGGGLLSACATLPTSPVVQVSATQGAAGQGGEGVKAIPVPPGPGWTPRQIVAGFISASGDDPQVARQYLASSYRASWHPLPWAAKVVDSVPTLTTTSGPAHLTPGDRTALVTLTTRQLATLNAPGPFEAGQYQMSPHPQPFHFELAQVGGEWRITHLDSSSLLILTAPDFLRDYQPRNLYFLAAPSSPVLVPEPVFVPQQASIDLNERASGLVLALLRSPSGWLGAAATTAFPPGTKLLSEVQVNGGDAVVDLGGAADKATAWQRQQMAAQLVLTLTSPSYMPASDIRSVVMRINHRAWQSGAQLLYQNYQGRVPQGSNGPLYHLGGGPAAGIVMRVLSPGAAPVAAPLPRPISRGYYKLIAVSPGSGPPQFAGCSGSTLWVSALSRSAAPRQLGLTVPCAALSWDTSQELWIAGGRTISVFQPGGGISPVETTGLAGDSVIALKVAPDGVRVAMIVRTPGGAYQLLIAAISRDQIISLGSPVSVGSDLLNPVSLSWYDADHLVVLDQSGAAAAQLYQVPLDGGASVQLMAPTGAASVAASGSGLAVGTGPAGQAAIWTTPRLNATWQPAGPGTAPVYPG